MKQIAIVLAVTACGPKQAKPRPVEQPRVAEPTSVGSQECPTDARDELAALRARVHVNPVDVLLDLGLQPVEFEAVAKALYGRRVTRVPTKPTPTVQVRTPNADDTRWWCVKSDRSGRCLSTRSSCEDFRAKMARVDDCKIRPPELTERDCVDVHARVDGIGQCEYQAVAACFERLNLLDKTKDLVCTPTIASCKDLRGFVTRRRKDDERALTDCAAVPKP